MALSPSHAVIASLNVKTLCSTPAASVRSNTDSASRGRPKRRRRFIAADTTNVFTYSGLSARRRDTSLALSLALTRCTSSLLGCGRRGVVVDDSPSPTPHHNTRTATHGPVIVGVVVVSLERSKCACL